MISYEEDEFVDLIDIVRENGEVLNILDVVSLTYIENEMDEQSYE